jgi:hypothetical protein
MQTARYLLRVLAALGLLTSITTAARASPVGDAAAALASYPGRIEETLHRVGEMPAMRWYVEYDCGTGCLGALCLWSHHVRGDIAFDWMAGTMQQRTYVIAQNNRAFATYFVTSLKGWKETLKPTDAAFDAATARIGAIQAQLNAGHPPTEAQRTEAVAALEDLARSLDAGQQRLGTLAEAMGRHIEGGQATASELQGWRGEVRRRITTTADEMTREIYRQACSGDGPAQVATLSKRANEIVDRVTVGFDALQQQGEETDKALRLVLGIMVDFSARYRTLAAQIRSVHAPQLGPLIQNIRLGIAKRGWDDFTDAVDRIG